MTSTPTKADLAAQLETQLQRVEQLSAELEALQGQAPEPAPIARGHAYLEGMAKFFEQGRNRTTGEPLNYFKFAICEQDSRPSPDGQSVQRIDLPRDQCYVSLTKRPELVDQLQTLFAANQFLVLRVHGKWRADGPITLVGNYLRAQYRGFWVTRVEVLTAHPRVQQFTPAPSAADQASYEAELSSDFGDEEIPF